MLDPDSDGITGANRCKGNPQERTLLGLGGQGYRKDRDKDLDARCEIDIYVEPYTTHQRVEELF